MFRVYSFLTNSMFYLAGNGTISAPVLDTTGSRLTTAPASVPTYIGCYPDYVVSAAEASGGGGGGDEHWTAQAWPDRAFPRAIVDRSGNSAQTCAAVAHKAGSPYFGLAAGEECWWV